MGAVTGCLIGGLLLGALIEVGINGTVKSLFFIMFLFALGYKVGPQFFRGLKKDGLPQVVNAVTVCVTGLLVCWGFAELLDYGPGLSAGLLGGALTQSAVIGVAQDAISQLPGNGGAKGQAEGNLVAVGYAVTYPLGTILCAVLLANIYPALLRRNLADESAKLARERHVPSDDPDLGEGYYETVLRASDSSSATSSRKSDSPSSWECSPADRPPPRRSARSTRTPRAKSPPWATRCRTPSGTYC